MENAEKKLYAVQFHPEVTHSQFGKQMLKNFLYEVCRCQGLWRMDSFIEDTVKALREEIGDKKVILGLSGGVDSSVAAGLISRAVGDQLTSMMPGPLTKAANGCSASTTREQNSTTRRKSLSTLRSCCHPMRRPDMQTGRPSGTP